MAETYLAVQASALMLVLITFEDGDEMLLFDQQGVDVGWSYNAQINEGVVTRQIIAKVEPAYWRDDDW